MPILDGPQALLSLDQLAWRDEALVDGPNPRPSASLEVDLTWSGSMFERMEEKS